MSYKTRDELLSAFQGLKNDYPGVVDSWVIGRTWQGRNIEVYRIGNPNGGRVLILATLHGVEILGSEYVWLYANWLVKRKEPIALKILRECCTYIVPALNLDSYAIKRKNQNMTAGGDGVDINRNFVNGWCYGSVNPAVWNYKGVAPLSEYETQAVYYFMRDYKPVWAHSLHTGLPPRIEFYWANETSWRDFYNATLERYTTIAESRGQAPIFLDPPEWYSSPRSYMMDDAHTFGIPGWEVELHP